MHRHRAAAAAALAWVLMGMPLLASAADSLCRQGPESAEPVAGPVAGCAEAVCTAVGDESLCTCKAGAGWRFERRRGAQTLQRWPTEVSPMTGPGAFSVTTADIDGDGAPEWLVARWAGSSNGLGVTYHNVCVVWPQRPGRAPLCRDVREWGALTVLVQEEGRSGCSLMDSDWKPGREPGDREGTYAVGRLLRLQRWQGQARPHWQPVARAERPAVARRLSNAFMDARETLPQRNAQQLWYQHPSASAVSCPGRLCPR